MQIAERVIDIIRDTEKQSPKLRAIVQHDKDEILKVLDCLLTSFSRTRSLKCGCCNGMAMIFKGLRPELSGHNNEGEQGWCSAEIAHLQW